MAIPFTAITGRAVYGNPFTPELLSNDDKTPKINPKTGEQAKEYPLHVAYAKDDPLWPAYRSMLKAADVAAWPQFHDPVTNEVRPGVVFADKIIDGDGYDTFGKPYSNKDGYAGHWIVKYTTQFAPLVAIPENGKWVQTLNEDAFQLGYFVDVSGSTKSNDSKQSPGMYRNFDMVAIRRTGPLIVYAGADPNAKFAAPPPGNLAPPPAPGPGALPPSVAAPPPAPPPVPAAPPPAPAPTVDLAAYRAAGWTDEQLVAAGHMPKPYGDFAAPPPAPPAPAPTPKPKALKAGVSGTYEGYVAAGWNDTQLIAAGLMDDYIPY